MRILKRGKWKMENHYLKKGLVISIMILFAVISIAPCVLSEDAKKIPSVTNTVATWIVDDEGDGDFTSIQDAIYHASIGDIIEVYSGEYIESINIYKVLEIKGKDVEFPPNGNDSGLPIINGNWDISAVHIRSDNVKIENFIIKNGNTSGLTVFANYSKINGNIITNNSWGIVLQRDYHSVTNNTITLNRHFGISLQWSNECNINNNIIIHNDIEEGIGYGIHFIFSNRNIISKNIIKYNKVGISVYPDSRGNIVTKNNFGNNTVDASFLSKIYIFDKPRTKWLRNYWGQARTLPYPIFGKRGPSFLPKIQWVEFDWRPAQEPYDI